MTKSLSATDKMLLSPVAYALAACSTAVEPSLGYALAAAGKLWDNQLNEMASYKELLHHADDRSAIDGPNLLRMSLVDYFKGSNLTENKLKA